MFTRSELTCAFAAAGLWLAAAHSEITGNVTDKAVVDTFFHALYENHSYATAGSNSGECWQAPRDLGNFLDSQTEESCAATTPRHARNVILLHTRESFSYHLSSFHGDRHSKPKRVSFSYLYRLSLVFHLAIAPIAQANVA
eukprot:SAG11_NODE_1194_length_5548_cov_3.456414_6_plen_141_part_00